MEKTEKDLPPNKSGSLLRKYNIREFIKRAKTLQGDPHYVAMGMAIGVFISITPTIPFHMVIAIALAFVFKGSKPAAAIGAWLCNPVTMPFFYLGSYKVGRLILGKTTPFDAKYESVFELMKLGMDVTIAMIVGGMILGIIPGIAAYFITRNIFTKIRARSKFKVDKSKP